MIEVLGVFTYAFLWLCFNSGCYGFAGISALGCAPKWVYVVLASIWTVGNIAFFVHSPFNISVN